MTMKETMLNNTDVYFVYSDLVTVLPNHTKQSIMGRVHELIELGAVSRIRKAAHNGKKVAIYQRN